MFPAEDITVLPSLQEELRKIEGLEVVRGSKVGLDVMVKGVSKGEALLAYGKSLGIEKDEIIVIGDSENDLSMLKSVGYPVTLENGEDCLKEIAKLVTPSNDEAGVAKGLKKIFKID